MSVHKRSFQTRILGGDHRIVNQCHRGLSDALIGPALIVGGWFSLTGSICAAGILLLS